ncbi:CRISPR-associated endonuclease Cas1 [Desulfatiferula olefinivorans]
MQIFVNSPGSMINQKDGCFRFSNKDKSFDVSPEKIESIVTTNKAMISTQAINLALDNNIDIIFLDSKGDPKGRVWFSKMGSTALIRRKQLEAELSEVGINLVIDLVREKVSNQIRFLKKLALARPGKHDVFTGPVQTLTGIFDKLVFSEENLNSIRNSIMGYEGSAGKVYFQCISSIMPTEYQFNGRSRRPAKDPFNAILNYGLGMLYSRVEKACIIGGLDPYIGFLHTDNYNKKSLVFDLIEPFRIYAEQTAVYLFTGKKIKETHFDRFDHSVALNEKGKPLVIETLNSHMDEKIRYRGRNIKRKNIIHQEAHNLTNILLADEGGKRPEWLNIKEF